MNDSEMIFGLMASFEYTEYSFEQLKYLAAPFDATETSLRTNLARMTKNNILVSRKEGKTALYRLNKKGGRISSNVAFSFRKLDWSQWDGRWWGVLFSVPNIESAQRNAIRTKLVAYRFANLYPGFWIRPLHQKEKIENCLESLIGSEYCTFIDFNFYHEITKDDVSRIWKTNEINNKFKTVLETVRVHIDKAAAYTPEEGLKYKMLIGNEIVNALFSDPMLPDMYLPSPWMGDELRAAFGNFDNTMTEIARPYIQKVINTQEQNSAHNGPAG